MPYRPPEERLEDVNRAHKLRSEGMTVSSIANAMGVARNTVSNWLNYPNSGELYRKRRRQFQMCPRCGRKMSYGASQCRNCRKGQ